MDKNKIISEESRQRVIKQERIATEVADIFIKEDLTINEVNVILNILRGNCNLKLREFNPKFEFISEDGWLKKEK